VGSLKDKRFAEFGKLGLTKTLKFVAFHVKLRAAGAVLEKVWVMEALRSWLVRG
jgi:hypothetical protein